MIQKKSAVLLFATAIILFTVKISAQQTNYYKTEKGVIVFLDSRFSGNVKSVQLRAVNDKIIRVTASPQKEVLPDKSLIVIQQPATVNWDLKETNETIEMATASVKARVSLRTGAVTFYDKNDKQILAEKSINGRSIQPALYEGEMLYSLKQSFVTTAEDAYYGLGQQQDDVWDYKGKQVVLYQNNSQVAIPFLVSAKNYGVLWDNYSYSKAGDIRPFQQLSSLKLFDKNGNPGWLTATYANDRNKPNDTLFEKAESEIWYPYMKDANLRLPKEFSIEKGIIIWQGSISTMETGNYHFKFTYGGYFKCWINGKLQFDKWRQSWNPGTVLVDLKMEAGKKYSIKIEWIPDGGESYVSAEFLPPLPPEQANTFSFDSEAGQQIDYYFVYGNNLDEVVKGYRQLTGKAPIVPRWAMGFWQSRERYKTQDELLNTVAEFRKRKIPLDNIVQDWFYWKESEWGDHEFDVSRFPNADSMINKLHKDYHTQLMISVWPKFYEGTKNYNSFNKKGWVYTRNIADRQKDWVGPGYTSTFYDVFNETARKVFWDLLNEKLFVKGVDAWWMDASEPDIQSNVTPEKRKQQMQPLASGKAAEFLNAYPLQNAKGIYEGQRSEDNSKRVFLLTRSAFAGSQRYAASIWSGDIGARWEDMRTQISAGMNYSISGLPYWTMDIGGFATENRYNATPMLASDMEEWRELQTRWYQWGSFLPLFRSHGQFPLREVFNIAPESHPAFQSMLYYNKLRYRLMPYIYSLAGNAFHHDYTIMRGLVMDFSNDKNVLSIGDQFMFGPSFLINPVYTYKANNRNVYLPAGQGWYDLYSGKYFTGGQTITTEAPYEKLPVFIKEGSIIPTGPELQYVAEKPADPITLFVYAGKDGSFVLYEDEGTNYNYENGSFSEIPFTYSESAKTLTIGDRKGSFNGMMKTRVINIKLINKDKPAGLEFIQQAMKKVKYAGKKTTIVLK